MPYGVPAPTASAAPWWALPSPADFGGCSSVQHVTLEIGTIKCLFMDATSDEKARAIRLVATSCAICARPLRDSISVEAGIGPECRKRYGYHVDVPPKFRAEANKLVHAIAINQTGLVVLKAADRLRELGFAKLAEAVSAKRAEVFIIQDEKGICVKAPYLEEATEAFRRIPGRKWSNDEKANRFPVSAKRELWAVLRTFYLGSLAVGPQGSFEIN